MRKIKITSGKGNRDFLKRLGLRPLWLARLIPAHFAVFFVNALISLYKRTVSKIQTLAVAEKASAPNESHWLYKGFRGEGIFYASLSVLVLTVFPLLITEPSIMIVKDISKIVNDLAMDKGDLTRRFVLDWKNELGTLPSGFNRFIDHQQTMAIPLKGTVDLLPSGADAIAEAAEMVSAGASNTEASANHANKIAENGSRTIENTVQSIQDIVTIVAEASRQMQGLETQSQSVGEVVEVIEEIANQTNLLSLNANIETPRAGDAWRGLTVVGDEVQNLAKHTVKATAEIGEKIKTIQSAIPNSVFAMAKINEQSQEGQRNASERGEALSEIVDAIHAVKRSMSQIAGAANEPSSGVEAIRKNVEALTSVSKDAAMSAQALSTAGEELRREIKTMEKMIQIFKA